MKGKVNRYKVILTLLILFMASVCFGVGILPKKDNKTYAVSTKVELGEDKKEFSALFDGDVVFSVEKVHVNSEEVDNLPKGLTTVADETFETFYGDEVSYNFKDISEGTASKQVVDNGEFVKLNNYYENNVYKNNSNIKHGTTDLQEAVMVSFGMYVYDKTNNIVKTADEAKTTYAGLTYLNVSLEKDGVKQTLPDIRNINIDTAEGGLFFDFAYLITQQNDNSNEGYYKFNLNYMINYVEYNAEFEFYMINHSSYSYIETYEGNQYYAYPTLGWNEIASAGFSQPEDATGYARYYIGKSGVGTTVSYPTLTYDYTKFKLKYTHTANQRNTEYDISYDVTHQTANLICNVTTSGNTTTMPNFELLDYDKSYKSNLVAIMLTEPGTYNVEFEYIYTGYNSANAPKVGIATDKLNLAIHGLSAKYSKHNYASAKMEYFELSNAVNNHIDLFVPNGYNINSNINYLKNENIGFAYSMVESVAREGDILKANSIDSLINASLKDVNNVNDDGITTENNDYAFLTNPTNITKIKDVGLVGKINEIQNELNAILVDEKGNSKIKYAQTNQGSIWLNGNDQFSSNSFYFYSALPITLDSIKENVNTKGTEPTNDDSYGLPYTNTSSFNKKGYYLVFVEVLPNGTNAETTKYWQVFAFRYSSSSVDIVLETVEGNPVGSGKYTNKDVVVSWKKPGVFDRDVVGYYYSVKEQNYTKEELLKTQEKPLNITETDGYLYANLGEEVEKGSFVKYLIKLKSEGETATYKTFTIDRQDISGVKAYLVKQMYSGSTSYYTYATDVSNNKIVVQYSITDSLATISWNNKASNAKIYASYSYTPFIITNASASSITLNKGQTAITTNYELGTTILGSEFKREDNPYMIDSDSILFNQGIYIMKIWDEAGNYTNYSFIIDKTENWFKLNNEYASNTSKMYGDNVDYTVGNFKAFELKLDAVTNSDVKDFVTLASNGSLAEFDHYYQGVNNNVSVISNLFQKVGDKYYFAVPNEKITAYKNEDVDTNIRALSGKLQFNKEELDGAGYYKRKLYVVSRNQINSTSNENDYSYVIVSINKDNSLGLAYFGSTNNFALPENGESSEDAQELMYGSDGFDAQGNATNGLTKAYATSAKYVAFVWNMGTGNFEVETLSYTFYTLKPSDYNNDKYFFYGSGQDYEVYSNGTFSNGGQQLSDGTGRAVIRFNVGEETKAGLYVVTRTYKNLGADLGDDDLVKNYYFIVDRNKIIDLRQGIGSYIELELMESEPGFNDFSIENTSTGNFSIGEDNIFAQYYNIYLSTTKLPATLVIPTGKYFDGTHSSADYYAGEVRVTVYFNDVDKQLPQTFKGFAHKIFDSKDATATNGYFNIDIYKYLSNVNVALRERLTVSDENGNWLFLSGEYIVRIQDKVVDETGNYHTTYIGFKITGADDNGPEVDTATGFTKENTIPIDINKDANFTYSATVSQEHLEVVIPAYDESEMENAQVDHNYLIVKQYYNNDKVGINYVNHPYTFKNGVVDITKESKNVIFNEDGSISIFLDTKLRVDPNDPTSEIDVKNLTTPLYYTITVRYKLTNGEGGNEKYKDCYVYHEATCHDVDCEGIKYYEATYTIKIDREAPSENINSLNDSLVNDYINAFETNSMFESGYHQTSSWVYFTKQYAKYYQEDKTEKGYIYVYQVFGDKVDAEGNVIEGTKFKSKDVERVYYNKIAGADNLNELSTYNLTLPMIDESKYEGYLDGGFETYSALGLTANSYYEIVEVDRAGNVTQYVIHFEPEIAEITIPVTIRKTTESEVSEENLSFETSNAPINIFNIAGNGETVVANDHFFKIELNKVDGTSVYTILTDVTTDFAEITDNIVEEMNKAGSASYTLKLISRTVTNYININLIDASKVNIKDASSLVEKSDTAYSINLNKVDDYNEELALWYFATEITVKYIDAEGNEHIDIYEGKINQTLNKVEYFIQGTETKKDVLLCAYNTTYQISMTDILGLTTSHRFNTSGQEFEILTFEEPGNYYLGTDGQNIIYYGYTDATLMFDKTVYDNHKIYVKNKNGVYQESSSLVADTTSDLVYNILKINSIYDEKTGAGGLIEVKVDLYNNEKVEKIYHITIDTRLATVALRDYSTGEFKDIIRIFNNVDYDAEGTRALKAGAGIMNLHWEKFDENNYFTYTYTLHELMDNNNYRSFDLSNANNYVINTSSGSQGVYKFEIRVYGKDGVYVGNRLYSFEVQEVSTQLYYVRNSAGEAINSNSSFKPSELTNLTENITTKFLGINVNKNIPLYITNETLEVVLTADSNVKLSEPQIIAKSGDSYEFIMYKISKEDAYDIYIGILQLKVTHTLVKDVIVGAEKLTGTTAFTIVGKPSDAVAITATRTNGGDASISALMNKNNLLVDVYYNGQPVGTQEFNGALEILGNGQYSFVFKDLAGNVHEFENDADKNKPETIDMIEVYVLREVVVLMNGEAPIANAFFNDAVELTVYRSTSFVTGSIKIEEAKRNGEDYLPKGHNSVYLFEDFGTYRVVISAKYLDPISKEEIPLRKVLLFTILNVKEARTSIDLTSLSGYNISKVLNQKGEDVTEAFMEMINKNANIGGMLVTYEKVMENANKLNVSSGKITFTVVYEVTDEAYQTREVELSFTLNNEKPKIDCSLKKGDSTTKKFNITFNPAIIYEQVGESYIYINNRLVAHIDETSENKEVKVTTSYKNHGDGDYYIKLINSSGTILESYKVTIKEPLNAGAVIIIIVVVALVATVVTTIIVLRRKMRIR